MSPSLSLQARSFTGWSLGWEAAPPPRATRRQPPPKKLPTLPSSVSWIAGRPAAVIYLLQLLSLPAFVCVQLHVILCCTLCIGHVVWGLPHLPPSMPEGMSGPYTRAKDPFLLYDLSQPSPVRDYARWFYNATAQAGHEHT